MSILSTGTTVWHGNSTAALVSLFDSLFTDASHHDLGAKALVCALTDGLCARGSIETIQSRLFMKVVFMTETRTRV